LFFLGSYVDGSSPAWWIVLTLTIVWILPVLIFTFVFAVLFYSLIPFCFVFRHKIKLGHSFLLLACIVASCLVSSVAPLIVFELDYSSFFVKGSFATLGLTFSFLLLTAVVCLSSGFSQTFAHPSYNLEKSDSFKFSSRVNGLMPYFLSIYFLLIAAPYCFARVPSINAFMTGTYTKVAYRGFTCLCFFAYSFLLGKANKKHMNIGWAILLSTLLVSYLIAWVFVPLSYSYYSISFNNALTFYTTSLGSLSIFISFGSFGLESAIFLCMLSFFPAGIKKRSAIVAPLVTVISLTFFACLMSAFLERSEWILYFEGNPGTATIRSIFHSKNAFGIFLFNGCFASLFLLFYLKKYWNLFCLPLVIIFLFVSYEIKCNTAFVSAAIIGFVLIFVFLFRSRGKASWAFPLCVGLTAAMVLVIVLGTSIPALRDRFSVFHQLYVRFINLNTDEILSRTTLWKHCLTLVRGPFVLVGETDVVADMQLSMIQAMYNDSTLYDFHSAFVSFYSAHGLVGLCVYLGAHAYSLKQIIKLRWFSRPMEAVLIVLFIGAVLFSMPRNLCSFH
jgi:hypothetical protein